MYSPSLISKVVYGKLDSMQLQISWTSVYLLWAGFSFSKSRPITHQVSSVRSCVGSTELKVILVCVWHLSSSVAILLAHLPESRCKHPELLSVLFDVGFRFQSRDHALTSFISKIVCRKLWARKPPLCVSDIFLAHLPDARCKYPERLSFYSLTWVFVFKVATMYSKSPTSKTVCRKLESILNVYLFWRGFSFLKSRPCTHQVSQGHVSEARFYADILKFCQSALTWVFIFKVGTMHAPSLPRLCVGS